jgi:hypothetical protein
VYSLFSQEATLVREQSTRQVSNPRQERGSKPLPEIHGKAFCKTAVIWKQLRLFHAALATMKAANCTEAMSRNDCSITADATAWHTRFVAGNATCPLLRLATTVQHMS